MEPFKNIFNKNSVEKLALTIKSHCPQFEEKNFKRQINKTLNKLELKDRVRLIAQNLHIFLPFTYPKNLKLLLKILAPPKADKELLGIEKEEWSGQNDHGINGFMVWPLTQYVEDFGRENLKASMIAMREMTMRFSSEFSIRPFINLYEKEVFKELKTWKKDKNHHVRRLVSEGTRPKLPWGIKVEAVHKNLKRNVNLIYSLRNDESLYVRRSVANHLNDISYLDEELFIETLQRMGNTEKESWVKRHATRSLLKKGHTTALEMHGYDPNLNCRVAGQLSTKTIKEGDSFIINLEVSIAKKFSDKKALIEYIIYYPKKNGQYSPKVFRLTDTHLKQKQTFEKRVHFKKVTTRTHYPGKYFIEIQINGRKYNRMEFELKI
ncbi:MAG: 3-methyladenine DNA glycosylase AlkC [Bacteriovoracaceae bacterium]|jgi:3-methyladenine DNA glycosylase AlkC